MALKCIFIKLHKCCLFVGNIIILHFVLIKYCCVKIPENNSMLKLLLNTHINLNRLHDVPGSHWSLKVNSNSPIDSFWFTVSTSLSPKKGRKKKHLSQQHEMLFNPFYSPDDRREVCLEFTLEEKSICHNLKTWVQPKSSVYRTINYFTQLCSPSRNYFENVALFPCTM